MVTWERNTYNEDGVKYKTEKATNIEDISFPVYNPQPS